MIVNLLVLSNVGENWWLYIISPKTSIILIQNYLQFIHNTLICFTTLKQNSNSIALSKRHYFCYQYRNDSFCRDLVYALGLHCTIYPRHLGLIPCTVSNNFNVVLILQICPFDTHIGCEHLCLDSIQRDLHYSLHLLG